MTKQEKMDRLTRFMPDELAEALAGALTAPQVLALVKAFHNENDYARASEAEHAANNIEQTTKADALSRIKQRAESYRARIESNAN